MTAFLPQKQKLHGSKLQKRISTMKLYTHFFLFFLIATTLLFAGGIKENAEKEIKTIFGDNVVVELHKLALSPPSKKKVEIQAKQRFFKDYLYAWKILRTDSLVSYAVLDNVYGKAMPITFLVILDSDGKITAARVIKYRESYGGSVGNINWLKQFIGKDDQSSYQIGKDVDAISGATISVNALTRGIKKITCLFAFIQEKLNK